jgi:hypothetical protein
MWQINVQRTDNGKTVKPIGQIQIDNYENEIFVRLENSKVGSMIKNQYFL